MSTRSTVAWNEVPAVGVLTKPSFPPFGNRPAVCGTVSPGTNNRKPTGKPGRIVNVEDNGESIKPEPPKSVAIN